MRANTFLALVIVGLLAACQDQQQPVDPIDAEFNAFFDAAESHRALVIHKGETWWCGIYDGNLQGIFPLYPVEVITQSRNGNAVSICHADGIANPTGRAIVWKPENFPYYDECLIWNGEGDGFEFPPEWPPQDWYSTKVWKQVISASGHATMTCHYNENK